MTGSIMIGLGIWICLVFWSLVVARWRQGKPVLPVAPRRPVPWRGLDLLLIVAVYILCMKGVAVITTGVYGADWRQPGAPEATTDHQVLQLIRNGEPWMIGLAAFSAVILAPVFEEMMFRLFLQGWFEAVDRRLRRGFRPAVRWGTLPVVTVAVLFALIHFRVPSAPLRPEVVAFLLLGHAIASLVTLVFAVVWICVVRGATAEDLGFVRGRILTDFGHGMFLFFAGIAVPLYVTQLVFHNLLADYFSSDPISLFPFALVLGVLYCRTHRIVPSISVHFSLNAASVFMLWLLS